MYSAEEITALGVKCLTEKLGVVGMESFIKTIKRESFDYTAWRQGLYDGISDDEVDRELQKYCQAQKYDGKAIVM